MIKVTFDFRTEIDCNDLSAMLTALDHEHQVWPVKRITMEYDPNTFGAIAAEAGVFNPVQITVEEDNG